MNFRVMGRLTGSARRGVGWAMNLLFLRSNSLRASLVNQIFDSPSQNDDGSRSAERQFKFCLLVGGLCLDMK